MGVVHARGTDVSKGRIAVDSKRSSSLTYSEALLNTHGKLAMRMHWMLAVAPMVLLGADAPKDDAAKKELEKFQGTWQLVSAEKDGKKAPEEQVKQTRVAIKGAKHTVYFGDKAVVHEIPFTIDPTTTPKSAEDKLPDGQTIKSIYQLDGDTLRSCAAAPGKERPTEFSAKEGSGQTLRVFKRVKSKE
jgi:uncharacterized protein (TIGR03067 family)